MIIKEVGKMNKEKKNKRYNYSRIMRRAWELYYKYLREGRKVEFNICLSGSWSIEKELRRKEEQKIA